MQQLPRCLAGASALALFLFSGLLRGQNCQGSPVGLTILFVDVDQADGTIVKSPSGRTLVVDAGLAGQGTSIMLPALRALGVTDLHATVATHYHVDHIGGLDEVLRGMPVTTAWDRGVVNVPSNTDYTSYVSAAGARRREILPGNVIDLGAGVTLTCIAVNGNLLGGGNVPVAASSQEENSRSIALKLTYGRFSIWLGGDLTGGGGSTADVESAAAPLVGDLDVAKLNHHGSSTSTNATFLSVTRPEACVASCGHANPYNHPSTDVINRVNTATDSRLLVSTTDGVNYTGYATSGGTIRLDTDGERYRITLANGQHYDLLVDEVTLAPPQPGELVCAEIMRNPNAAIDAKGEYVEVMNVAARPLSLRGLRFTTNSGAVNVVPNYRLLPGERTFFIRHGNPLDNGGIGGGHVLPYSTTFGLGDTADTVSLLVSGSVLVERVVYAAGFPGAAGIAAERADLLAAPAAAAFAPATAAYGSGDRGTPGARNTTDRTVHPPRASVDTTPQPNGAVTLHLVALSNPNELDLGGLAFGNLPGFAVGPVVVPLNPDPLFLLGVSLPGAVSLVPASGYRCWSFPVSAAAGLTNTPAWAAHLILDLVGPNPVRVVSGAAFFRFP
jgi:beta-lactamase superfamily II metal-dependent hydrolase